MLTFVFTLLLLAIVLLAIEIRKSYYELPTKELKYRAAHGDELAQKLYRVAAYENSLDIFLWLIIILASAGSLALFNSIAPLWLSFIAIVLLLAIGFAWLPKAKTSSLTNHIVVGVIPVVAAILNHIYPLFKHFDKTKGTPHTGVYDKADLVELITKQKSQPDSRINDRELDLLKHSLKLTEVKVSEVCKPWAKVKKVNMSDLIGPVLLDELHKSKQSLIPVVEDSKASDLVGILDTQNLDVTKQAIVSELMDKTIYFINEEDSLSSALEDFALTNYPLLIVIDSSENLVGSLLLSDVIERLVGKLPKDNLDKLTSLPGVAAKYSQNQQPTESSDQEASDQSASEANDDNL